MSDLVESISPHSRDMAQVEALLHQEGIRLDPPPHGYISLPLPGGEFKGGKAFQLGIDQQLCVQGKGSVGRIQPQQVAACQRHRGKVIQPAMGAGYLITPPNVPEGH